MPFSLFLLVFVNVCFRSKIASENDSKNDICKLKAKLASFVAFESKPRTSRFVEYWVPVQLSNVQLEQYCAALLSSETLLCSHLRNDSVDSLRKILIMTRKVWPSI